MPARVLIGVHGLSPKPPETPHTAAWIHTIREGLSRNCAAPQATLDRLVFELVYWAGWLGRDAIEPDKDKEPYVAATGQGPLPSYEQRWRDVVALEALGLIGKKIDLVKGAPPLEFLRERVGLDEIGLAFLELRVVDLATYYGDAEKRAGLRKLLADKLIKHKDKRIMLVAHSMGSIVAYDVLRELGREQPGLTIEHFVTLGSPLGMPYVLANIRRENALVRTPSIVQRWTNLADRRDPVAIDVHLGDEFGKNDAGVVVKDALVLNGYVAPGGKENHHKIYGYLRTPEFSELVNGFI